MEKKPAPATRGGKFWSNPIKNGFRVTGWFKQGEIEELVRSAAASTDAQDPFAGPVAGPIVVEDATLTAGDHTRLSLGADADAALAPSLPAALLADRMSDQEMFAQFDRSHVRMVVAGAIVGLTSVAATISYFLLH